MCVVTNFLTFTLTKPLFLQLLSITSTVYVRVCYFCCFDFIFTSSSLDCHTMQYLTSIISHPQSELPLFILNNHVVLWLLLLLLFLHLYSLTSSATVSITMFEFVVFVVVDFISEIWLFPLTPSHYCVHSTTRTSTKQDIT